MDGRHDTPSGGYTRITNCTPPPTHKFPFTTQRALRNAINEKYVVFVIDFEFSVLFISVSTELMTTSIHHTQLTLKPHKIMKMFQFIKKAAVMMAIVMGGMFTAEAQCIHKAGIQERRDACMHSLDKDPFSPSMQMEAVRLTGELYEPCPICDAGSSTGSIYPPLPLPGFDGRCLPPNTNINGDFTPGGNGLYNNKNGDMTNYIGSFSRKTSSSQWFEIALVVVGCIACFALMLMIFVSAKNKKAGKPTDFASVLADSLKAFTDFFVNIWRKIKANYSSAAPAAVQNDQKAEGAKQAEAQQA